MLARLDDDTVRVRFLDGGLAILFACAWASDTWPAHAFSILVLAVGSVAMKTFVLWKWSRIRTAQRRADPEGAGS